MDEMNEIKKGRGVRYSNEQKQEVMDFVKSNPGRGAMKQAQDKFGVSYIAIRDWLKKSGEEMPTRGSKIKGEAPRGKALRPLDDGRFDKAKKMIDKIREAEIELRSLYADLNDLLKP